MRGKEFLDKMGQIDGDLIEGAGMMPARKRKLWVKWGIAAACLALVLTVGIPVLKLQSSGKNNISLGDGDKITLSDASKNVKVKYTNKHISSSVKADLVWLTEEEMFSDWSDYIFKGTVKKINNIEIDFNGTSEYRAVAEITVEKVYRGEIAEGGTVKVLLPCSIGDDTWVEDTDVVSQMRTGMKGIFMPKAYDDRSYWEEHNARLYLKDIAPCGFGDGVRWMFLETDNGLSFERNAYKSISNAKTLEEVEKYVLKMINK